MNENSVARRCWDEDAEMEPDYSGIPYMFDEPDEIDLFLQREHEEREELWKPSGQAWRDALKDIALPALARRQAE